MITIGDKERWKKHYRSFKRLAYAETLSEKYRENYDRIKWAKDGEVCVVMPDIGGEDD